MRFRFIEPELVVGHIPMTWRCWLTWLKNTV